MPRFFDPQRYNEDWYIELKGEYQKFFDYIIEMCDNAGVWKPNKFDFEIKTGFRINLDSFLKKVNGDNKERIFVLENGRWLVPGFVKFQWFNKKDSFELTSHPLHKNIIDSLKENKVPLEKIKGLLRAKEAFKAKDKEIDIGKGGTGEKQTIPVVDHSGVVTWNAEKTILENQIELERISISVGNTDLTEVKGSLRKYHLHLAEKEQYPKGKKAVFAGFEKWLLNEKKIFRPIAIEKQNNEPTTTLKKL